MRVLIVPIVVAALLAVATPAHAGPIEPPAFTEFSRIVLADTFANVTETQQSVGDNLTCDPQPVVDGHMLNPRAGIVVGEVYGQAEIAAHWKCASLDTGAFYALYGTVTDWYYEAGTGYRAGGEGHDTSLSTAGAATVNPRAVLSYPGGHPGLNTWHFARFVGTTSTGRQIAGDSPLFYVAGV